MTKDPGIRVVLPEGFQQVPEGALLSFGTSVSLLAVDVEASLVTHSDGVFVVVPGMRTDEVLMTGLIYLSITGDVVVVAGEPEALRMIGNEGLNRVGFVLPRR